MDGALTYVRAPISRPRVERRCHTCYTAPMSKSHIGILLAGAVVILIMAYVLLFVPKTASAPDEAPTGEEWYAINNSNNAPPTEVMEESMAEGAEHSMANENTIVVMQTSKGAITLELFTDKMPITTGNFLKLVQDGFYDGIKFHRVIPDFMIQGGDPLTKDDSMQAKWGTGGPGYTIKDEFGEGLSNVRGTLAMANAGANTGGSQFFINVADNTFLDPKHPVFGRVVEGMEVADAIVNTPRDPSDRPTSPVTISKISIK